jgi:hypothetical protein
MTAAGTGADEGDGAYLQRAANSSRLVAAVRAVGRWARQSFLYRWLTKEPDPEVIVIDLRETYTVGPIIGALDWTVTKLAPWWRASGVRRLCASAADQFRERPIHTLGVMLIVAVAMRLVVGVAAGNLSGRTVALSLALFGAGAIATRSDHSMADLRDTRGYELLAAALEPPEPPEKADVAPPDPDEPGVPAEGRNEDATATTDSAEQSKNE